MKYTIQTQSAKNVLLVTLLTVAIFGIMANTASAQITQPVTSCAQQTIVGFVPYVYEGELHSFDYVVPGKNRDLITPIQTVIGGKSIDVRYSTEWTLDGNTRIHVDVPAWEGFSGTLPVMVHVKTINGVTCETQGNFTVALPGKLAQPANPDSQQDFGTGGPLFSPPTLTPVSAGTQTDTTEPTATQPPSVAVAINEDKGRPAGELGPNEGVDGSMETEIGTSTEGDNAYKRGLSALASLFVPVTLDGGMCETLPLASWIILALVHIAIAGAIIFFLRNLISESNLWFALALLVPFVGFLALWFVFDGCRTYQWFPVLVALVSLATVLGVPSGNSPKKKATSTGGPVMKVPGTASKESESESPKSKSKKEEVIKF